MKIAVNLLYLEQDTKTGIGKHIEDILVGLEQMNVLDEFYLIIQETFYENYFCSRKADRLFNNVNFIVCREGRLLKSVIKKLKREFFFRGLYLNYFIMPGLLKKNKFDLIFYPFNETTNNVSSKYPVVTVIHDLFYKNFPNPKRAILSKLYTLYVDFKHRKMLKKAKKVIAISEFVKSDILKHFRGIKSDNIVVIPNAVAMSGETVVPEEIKKPFLLNVSVSRIHKNQLTLLKAYSILKDKVPHRLVLLGDLSEDTPVILKYIDEKGLKDKIDLINDISDFERNWLYANTDLFIFPSLHEGFGRPPVEAAMMETTVLTSRATSLPEVTHEMLNYYDPATDENVLADKILELLARPTPVNKREQIAETFKELYDPGRIARLYYDLFCNIVQNNRR
ncbi:MAG: glycosyltransferase family 1 protein [Smithella sp.]